MSWYNGGLDVLRDIATLDLRWLLLKGSGYTFDRDHDFVSALTPGSNEVTVTGYARVAISGESRTVDDSNNRVVYACDDPDFGTLATGENVSACVLYVHDGGGDGASRLVAYFPAPSPVDTAVEDPFIGVEFTGGLLAVVAEDT